MDAKLEHAILLACLKAIEALGESYTGMSCFLNNWNSAKLPE